MPTNLGIGLVVLGRPMDSRWSLALDATIVTTVVFLAYRRLRNMRKGSGGVRCGWIVRAYERAHGAFLRGAILGSWTAWGGYPAAGTAAWAAADRSRWSGRDRGAAARRARSRCPRVGDRDGVPTGRACRLPHQADRAPLDDIVAVGAWFPVLVAVDALVVAAGAWR